MSEGTTANSKRSIVRTQRLIVRRFAHHDVNALHTYRNLDDVARHQGWQLPYTYEQAELLVAEMVAGDPFGLGAWTQLAVAHAHAPEALIGDVAVRLEREEPTAEVGFSLHPDHWGQGLMAEALDGVVSHLFSMLGLARVVAFTDQANERAQRTLERAGLRYLAMDGNDLVYYRRND